MLNSCLVGGVIEHVSWPPPAGRPARPSPSSVVRDCAASCLSCQLERQLFLAALPIQLSYRGWRQLSPRVSVPGHLVLVVSWRVLRGGRAGRAMGTPSPPTRSGYSHTVSLHSRKEPCSLCPQAGHLPLSLVHTQPSTSGGTCLLHDLGPWFGSAAILLSLLLQESVYNTPALGPRLLPCPSHTKA